jgi:REP element-mobilizing transposase RayT
MTQSRKAVVSANEFGVYHCISRCVRRAFLCGEDSYSGNNYEHRREWVRERIELLSGLFGMDVFAYAVMSNHLHLVVRSRPDRVLGWSDVEVAERWCKLVYALLERTLGASSEPRRRL